MGSVLQRPHGEFFSSVLRKPKPLPFLLVALPTWRQENAGVAARAWIHCAYI